VVFVLVAIVPVVMVPVVMVLVVMALVMIVPGRIALVVRVPLLVVQW